MADAYTKQLKNYIKEQSDRGFETKKIVKHLLKSGISKKQIDKAMKSLGKKTSSSKKQKKSFWTYAGISISVLIIILVFVIIFFAPARCTTEECFVGKANNCMAATYTNKIGKTVMYYETNDCILIKTVKEMSDDEPRAVVNAFLEKSMRCRFNKNDFSPLFIHSITGHMEACEGPLKEQILQAAI